MHSYSKLFHLPEKSNEGVQLSHPVLQGRTAECPAVPAEGQGKRRSLTGLHEKETFPSPPQKPNLPICMPEHPCLLRRGQATLKLLLHVLQFANLRPTSS